MKKFLESDRRKGPGAGCTFDRDGVYKSMGRAAVLFAVGLGLLLAVQIAAVAAPSYTNETSDATSRYVPWDTVMWSVDDPYAFSAIRYNLYYADLFRTNGVQKSDVPGTFTNYVTQEQFNVSTNSLQMQISSNDTDIAALSALSVSTTNKIAGITNDVDLIGIEIEDLNDQVSALATNPPVLSGVITSATDVIRLWQASTNIFLDARGYRYLYTSVVVTGYTCTAQSGIDTNLVGEKYYLAAAPDTRYLYTELNDSFTSTLQFTPASGHWLFSYTQSEPLSVAGSGAYDDDPLTFSNPLYDISFARSTNLLYETYTYLGNFVTSNGLEAAVGAVTSELTGYVDASTNSIIGYTDAADAVLQAQITANSDDITDLRADVDSIVQTNLGDLVTSFFTTNVTTKLWENTGSAVSNRFVTLESDYLVQYQVATNTVWYLTAENTGFSNGTFRLVDTPLWNGELDTPSGAGTSYYTEEYPVTPWRFYVNYRDDSLPAYTNVNIGAYPESTTDHFWEPLSYWDEGYHEADASFTPSTNQWEYIPASRYYIHRSETDPGTVTVHWAFGLVTNEISRIYIGGGTTPDGGDVKAVNEGGGVYSLWIYE